MPEIAKNPKKWRLIHGVLLYAGIQAATFGLEAIVRSARNNTEEDTKKYYGQQKQPIFAPPAWAFPPVWTINNVLCLYGLLRVLNLPEETTGRSEFINLQIASWADFVLFAGASFGLRSNYHSAVLTNLYLLLTLASLSVALEKLKDEKTALSLSTLIIWLGIASPLSLTIAAWNGDEFYGFKPIAEPPPEWLKR